MNYIRDVEIVVNNRIYSNKDFDMAFEIPFNDDSEANESKIEIYNLSNDSINLLKNSSKIIVNAGYQGNIGSVLIGDISKIDSKNDGLDKNTIIHVLDSSEKWATKSIEKSYKKNIKASQIISDLASFIGVPIGSVSLPKNTSYPRGFIASGKVVEVMKRIATDCNAIAYVHKGKLYVRSPKIGDDIKFLLNSETGLIGSPEYFEDDNSKGYKITSLLNHRIGVASIIQLDSVVVKGTFRVRKGRHYMTESLYYTEMEVVAV